VYAKRRSNNGDIDIQTTIGIAIVEPRRAQPAPHSGLDCFFGQPDCLDIFVQTNRQANRPAVVPKLKPVKDRAYPNSDRQQQSNDWYDDSGFHTTGLARRVAKFQRHQHACSLSCKYRPPGGEWCTGRKERHWVEPHTHNLEYYLPDHPDADPDGHVRIPYTQSGFWQETDEKCTDLPTNNKANWPGITMNLQPSQLWTRIDPKVYDCSAHCPRNDCRRAPQWQGPGN